MILYSDTVYTLNQWILLRTDSYKSYWTKKCFTHHFSSVTWRKDQAHSHSLSYASIALIFGYILSPNLEIMTLSYWYFEVRIETTKRYRTLMYHNWKTVLKIRGHADSACFDVLHRFVHNVIAAWHWNIFCLISEKYLGTRRRSLQKTLHL